MLCAAYQAGETIYSTYVPSAKYKTMSFNTFSERHEAVLISLRSSKAICKAVVMDNDIKFLVVNPDAISKGRKVNKKNNNSRADKAKGGQKSATTKRKMDKEVGEGSAEQQPKGSGQKQPTRKRARKEPSITPVAPNSNSRTQNPHSPIQAGAALSDNDSRQKKALIQGPPRNEMKFTKAGVFDPFTAFQERQADKNVRKKKEEKEKAEREKAALERRSLMDSLFGEEDSLFGDD